MITRRGFFRWTAGLIAAGATTAAYGIGVEPFRITVTRYRFKPRRWTEGLKSLVRKRESVRLLLRLCF